MQKILPTPAWIALESTYGPNTDLHLLLIDLIPGHLVFVGKVTRTPQFSIEIIAYGRIIGDKLFNAHILFNYEENVC